MVKPGTKIEDKTSGYSLEFLETNATTGGKQVKIKWTFNPGGVTAGRHIHAMQDETFEVVSGHYSYEVGGKEGKISAGEIVTFPKGIPHYHYNSDQVDAVVIQTVTPAYDFENIICRIAELNSKGKIKNGQPPMLEAMVWLRKYDAKTYLAGIPVGVQKALALVLAPVGEMLGYGK